MKRQGFSGFPGHFGHGRFPSVFQAYKANLGKDAFIRYPDHNKPFQVSTAASAYQLGAIIMQETAPVAFFSRTLSLAPRDSPASSHPYPRDPSFSPTPCFG
jgi:hypothetical protein